MLQYKETKKLYQGKYQHRIVLVCSGVHVFRGGNLDNAFKKLSALVVPDRDEPYYMRPHYTVRYQAELDYLFDVYSCLLNMNNYAVRVEHPWLSIYSDNENDIIALKNINQDRVREIYRPVVNLSVGEVLSTLPFDYKVIIKPSKDDYSAFVEWSKQFDTIKLTNSCRDSLVNDSNHYIETYFYISGDKTLTMAKLHLGGIIKRIEKIVRA